MFFDFFSAPPAEQEPDKYIIVPPVLALDRKQNNRMAYSSYDWAFGKRELGYLLEQFFQPGPLAKVHLSPLPDKAMMVSANLLSSEPFLVRQSSDKALKKVLNGATGGVQLRVQPFPGDPLSFIALNSNFQTGAQPSVQGAVLHTRSGLGAFTEVAIQHDCQHALAGVRYASPSLSAGAVANAATGTLDKAWLLARRGAVTLGAQAEPAAPLGRVAATLRNAPLRCVSACAQYQLAKPDSSSAFVASVEVERGSTLRVSVFQHLARVRRVYNLFEDDDVVGITNYLDLGLSVASQLSQSSAAAAGAPAPPVLQAAASWQVNSNVLVKARAGTDRVAAAVVVKSWWNPSFTVSANAGWDFAQQGVCLGASLQVDDDSELRYERGLQTVPTGSLVRQRHVATRTEADVAEGQRTPVEGPPGGAAPPPAATAHAELL